MQHDEIPYRYGYRNTEGTTYELVAERSPAALMDTAIRSANGIVSFPREWKHEPEGRTSMQVFVPDFYIREWETRLRFLAHHAQDVSWRKLPVQAPRGHVPPAAALGDLGPLSRPSFLATLGPSITPSVKREAPEVEKVPEKGFSSLLSEADDILRKLGYS